MEDFQAIVKPKDSRFIDLTNSIFGEWKVLYYGGKWGKNQKTHYWFCECTCGRHKLVAGSSLRKGISCSCGCKRQEFDDLTGIEKDYLTVIKRIENTENGKLQWLCDCKCGKKVKRTSDTLKSSYVSSCGCYVKENLKKQNVKDLTGMKFGRLKVLSISEYVKQTRWLCKCECGKEVIVLARSLRSGHTKSCGCFNIEKSTERVMKVNKLRGKEHHCYNPSISDEDRVKNRFAYGPEIKKWRIDVFERDNFTCQCCNVKGVLLNAHHLNGYHWCKEERFEINNGITLCVECHKKFHSQYGRKNNTKEQFNLFLDSIKSLI